MHKDGEIYKEEEPEEYVTNLYTNEAVRIIEQHDSRKPLFLSIQHLAPHIGNYVMEAPQEVVDRFNFINDTNRQHLAGKYLTQYFEFFFQCLSKFRHSAMITVLDEGIGTVVTALKDKGILKDTIIFLYVDNGAGTRGAQGNFGSNFPLRGVSLKLNFICCFVLTSVDFTAKKLALGRRYKKCWIHLQPTFKAEPIHLQRLFPYFRYSADFRRCCGYCT